MCDKKMRKVERGVALERELCVKKVLDLRSTPKLAKVHGNEAL